MKQGRRKEMKIRLVKRFVWVSILVGMILAGSVLSVQAKRETECNETKHYCSIMVQKEDTLWTLAKQYADSEHYSTKWDYIKEIKKINQLSSDQITYGGYLIVTYYQ